MSCLDNKNKLRNELSVKIEREIGRRGGGVQRVQLAVGPCPLHGSTEPPSYTSTAIATGSFAQVAGHPDSLLLASAPAESTAEIVAQQDSVIAKAMVAQEVQVYQHVLSVDPSLCACPRGKEHVPASPGRLASFFCPVVGTAQRGEDEYLLLRRFPPGGLPSSALLPGSPLTPASLATAIVSWCQIDVKLGTSTVYPSAPVAKAAAARSKDESCSSAVIGLRLTGGRVCRRGADGGDDVIVSFAKKVGKGLRDEADVRAVLTDCFGTTDGGRQTAQLLADKVDRLASWLDDQRLFTFYGASVLLAYSPAWTDGPTDARLIDLARTVPYNDTDNGVPFGARNLARILRTLHTPTTCSE